MSLRRTNFQCWLTLAAVTGGLLLANLLPAAGPPGPPPGKSIKFSSSYNDQGTNVNQIGTRRDGLKQLEEELSKSLQRFSPGSLDGLPAPQARPVLPRALMPNKRTQEQMERRRNWTLMDPNDLTSGPTLEDVLDVPTFGRDGQPKKKTSAVEDFLYPERAKGKEGESEANSSMSGRESTRESNGDKSENPDSRDTSNLPDALKESQRKLHENLSSLRTGEPNARSGWTDIFGVNSKIPTEPDPVQKARQEEWNNLWGVPKASTLGVAGVNPMFDTSRPAATPAIPVPTVESSPVPKPDVSASSFGSLQSFKGGIADLGPKPLTSYTPLNPGLALPQPEPVKLKPPSPDFSAPRRTFN